MTKGYNACSYCEIHGESIQKNKGYSIVYVVTDEQNKNIRLKTHENICVGPNSLVARAAYIGEPI